MPPEAPDPGDGRFLRRVLMTIAIVALCGLAIALQRLILLAFGAVVVAVLIRTLADPLARRTGWPDRLAVFLAILAILGVLGAAGWLFGHEVSDQADRLSVRLPAAWEAFERRLSATVFGARLLDQIAALGDETNRMFAVAPRIAASGAAAATNLLLIVVGGGMLAMHPRLYREGLLALAPARRRDGLRGGLDAVGRGLRLWLLGQFVSMAVIGGFTGLGLWWAGVPSPLALGLLAGLAQFVPVVGPLASSLPGLLLAASAGWDTLGWTLLVYVGVQQLETNLITPYVQRRLVQIPMALTLFAVVGFGILFGPLGVLFATPLAVALFIAVRRVLDTPSPMPQTPAAGPPPAG